MTLEDVGSLEQVVHARSETGILLVSKPATYLIKLAEEQYSHVHGDLAFIMLQKDV